MQKIFILHSKGQKKGRVPLFFITGGTALFTGGFAQIVRSSSAANGRLIVGAGA